MKDTLYSKQHENLTAFQFDESVVTVFPDMIQRSVPGYQTILTGIGELAAMYSQPSSNLYDLGCSLGAATLTMRRKITHPDCQIFAIDNSQAMIKRATEQVQAYHSDIPVKFIYGDMTEINIHNASVVILNFTLQFVKPAKRQPLINKIYQALKPDGILIVSEKIHFENDHIQQAIENLHLQFKRANGYSELEISQKRSSLDEVLISDSEKNHLERFQQAGFHAVSKWFQTYNFVSFLAIKTGTSK